MTGWEVDIKAYEISCNKKQKRYNESPGKSKGGRSFTVKCWGIGCKLLFQRKMGQPLLLKGYRIKIEKSKTIAC